MLLFPFRERATLCDARVIARIVRIESNHNRISLLTWQDSANQAMMYPILIRDEE